MSVPQSALRLAIDLSHRPSQVRALRDERLPSDVDVVLRIVGGDPATLSSAVEATGRTERALRDAAAFYVEQILLSPDADSYRVLGATSFSSAQELRRNMALLMHWLHPDVQQGAGRIALANRVNAAWETLKTDERRAAYDRQRLEKLELAQKMKRRAGPRLIRPVPKFDRSQNPGRAGPGNQGDTNPLQARGNATAPTGFLKRAFRSFLASFR
jgi:DnaJ domain